MIGAVHAFSQILRIDSSFAIDKLRDDIPAELVDDLASRVKKTTEAFAAIFAPQKVDKDGRPIEPTEEAAVEKPDGGDGSGPAGPAAA